MLVAALVGTLAPLLTVTLSVSTTLLLSMLLLRVRLSFGTDACLILMEESDDRSRRAQFLPPVSLSHTPHPQHQYTRSAAAAQSSTAFLWQLAYPRVAAKTLSYASPGCFENNVKCIPSTLNEVLTPTGVVMPRVVHRVLDPQVESTVEGGNPLLVLRLVARGNNNPHPANKPEHGKTKQPQDINPRVIVVGDVHGCLDELQALLEKAEYDKERDSVVLVGDLVNKGPKSAETVRYAREQGFFTVRGACVRACFDGGGGGGGFCKGSDVSSSFPASPFFTRHFPQAITTTARWRHSTSAGSSGGRARSPRATATWPT